MTHISIQVNLSGMLHLRNSYCRVFKANIPSLVSYEISVCFGSFPVFTRSSTGLFLLQYVNEKQFLLHPLRCIFAAKLVLHVLFSMSYQTFKTLIALDKKIVNQTTNNFKSINSLAHLPARPPVIWPSLFYGRIRYPFTQRAMIFCFLISSNFILKLPITDCLSRHF